MPEIEINAMTFGPFGVGRHDGPADDQAGRVAEFFLADNLTQFFDDSGEHAARLSRQLLLAEEARHRIVVEVRDRDVPLRLVQPAGVGLLVASVKPGGCVAELTGP